MFHITQNEFMHSLGADHVKVFFYKNSNFKVSTKHFAYIEIDSANQPCMWHN